MFVPGSWVQCEIIEFQPLQQVHGSEWTKPVTEKHMECDSIFTKFKSQEDV